MSEYIISIPDDAYNRFIATHGVEDCSLFGYRLTGEIVRCRDCKHLDDSEYRRWDSTLAEIYGEPPLFCDLLSFNEWRMDGDRRVAETTFAEVEPDGFCAWGERKENHAD